LAALHLPDYQLAREAFTSVLHQNPRHVVAAGGLCYVLSALAELELAVQQCQQAVRLQPNNGRFLGELAHVLLRLQRPTAALQVAQQAVAVAPQLPLSHRMLGDAYAALGEVTRATNAYRSTLQLDPTDHLAQQGLQRLQHQQP
jgi:Tfp pilus assembly protein PilF